MTGTEGVGLMEIILIVAAVLAVIFCAVSAGFAVYITHGRRQTLDEAWNWQQEHAKDASDIKKDMLSDYIVKSGKGEDIHTSFLPASEPSRDFVILAHGYTDNRYGMIKYAIHYHKMGFNCVLFDERGHGENAKEPCSYSVREVDFLLAVIRDTIERYGNDIFLGIHGESLGGATVLMSLKYKTVAENVSFVVDDCGFADIIPVLRGCMKMVHMPEFMVYPADIAARIIYGISFKAAAPIESVRNNTIPLLCIHGALDDFILPEHSRRVYEADAGEKEIWFAEKAGHAQSTIKDPDGYFEVLSGFVNKVKTKMKKG